MLYFKMTICLKIVKWPFIVLICLISYRIEGKYFKCISSTKAEHKWNVTIKINWKLTYIVIPVFGNELKMKKCFSLLICCSLPIIFSSFTRNFIASIPPPLWVDNNQWWYIRITLKMSNFELRVDLFY